MKTTTSMAAIAALVLASVALPAQADHVRRTYKVVVQSSAGTVINGLTVNVFPSRFVTCFRFDQPQSTVLTIDGLGSIFYTHGGLGNRLTRFKGLGLFTGVCAGDVCNPVISFFGRFRRNFRRISGEGVSEVGDPFIFSGRRREGCDRSSVDSAGGALGSPFFEAE